MIDLLLYLTKTKSYSSTSQERDTETEMQINLKVRNLIQSRKQIYIYIYIKSNTIYSKYKINKNNHLITLILISEIPELGAAQKQKPEATHE